MAFNKKTWKARQGNGLNKFSIGGQAPTTISPRPDSLTVSGDAFSDTNMNDLENRIDAGFKEIYGNSNGDEINIYVAFRGEGIIDGDGTYSNPFTHVQNAVNSIPRHGRNNYIINIQSGQYMENVKVFGLSYLSLEFKAVDPQPPNTGETGVAILSILVDSCAGYTLINGLTFMTKTANIHNVSAVRCAYLSVGNCRFADDTTSSSDRIAIRCSGTPLSIWGNYFRSQNIAVQAFDISLGHFGSNNGGFGNRVVLHADRSIMMVGDHRVLGAELYQTTNQAQIFRTSETHNSPILKRNENGEQSETPEEQQSQTEDQVCHEQ